LDEGTLEKAVYDKFMDLGPFEYDCPQFGGDSWSTELRPDDDYFGECNISTGRRWGRGTAVINGELH